MNDKPSADKDKTSSDTKPSGSDSVKRHYFIPEDGISIEAESLEAAVAQLNKTKQKVSNNDK